MLVNRFNTAQEQMLIAAVHYSRQLTARRASPANARDAAHVPAGWGWGQVRVSTTHDITLAGRLRLPAGTVLWVPYHAIQNVSFNWDRPKDFLPGEIIWPPLQGTLWAVRRAFISLVWMEFWGCENALIPLQFCHGR